MHRFGANQPRAQPPTTHEHRDQRALKPRSGGSDEPEQEPRRARPSALSAEHPVDVPARGVAGQVEPAADPGDAVLGGEAPADRGEAGAISGSSTRSPKGRSSSRSRRSRRRAWMASTAASERATPLFGALVEHAGRGDGEHDRRRRSAPGPSERSSGFTSDLDLDDARQPERADDEQDDADAEHGSRRAASLHERMEVRRVAPAAR